MFNYQKMYINENELENKNIEQYLRMGKPLYFKKRLPITAQIRKLVLDTRT